MQVIKKRIPKSNDVGSFTTQMFEGQSIRMGEIKLTLVKVNDDHKKDAVKINIQAPHSVKISK
jgi:hypothetical protein